MDTTIINIRTQAVTKKAAQNIANDLGLSLSALINSFLKQLIRTKAVDLKITAKPTKYLLQVLKESKKDINKGRVSPAYKRSDEALAWLHDKNKKYEYQIHKKVR